MSFRDLFVLLLVGTFGFSRGMDTEKSSFPFLLLPQDVQHLILKWAWDTDNTCHSMHNGYNQATERDLLIPYTLRFIDPVQRYIVPKIGVRTADDEGDLVDTDDNEDTSSTHQEKKVVLDHQLWVQRGHENLVRLRHQSICSEDF